MQLSMCEMNLIPIKNSRYSLSIIYIIYRLHPEVLSNTWFIKFIVVHAFVVRNGYILSDLNLFVNTFLKIF